MKYIDAELLQKEIERQIMGIIKKQDANPDIPKHRWYLYEGMKEAFNDIGGFIDSLQQEQPEVFDTVAFQRGVQEGRRLEREDALTIADIEKLHTFLYAVKNNKQGAFTFTRLSDEQYEEVLRRFNKTKEQ